jgi:hypothetical protein
MDRAGRVNPALFFGASAQLLVGILQNLGQLPAQAGRPFAKTYPALRQEGANLMKPGESREIRTCGLKTGESKVRFIGKPELESTCS